MKLLTHASTRFNGPLLRFLAVGGGVAALDFVCFLSLVAWGVDSVWANISGMTVGFFAGLWGHHAITFRVQESLHWPVVVRYGLSFAFNLALGTVALQLLLWGPVPTAIAKLMAIVLVAASNFVVSKFFVFRQL